MPTNPRLHEPPPLLTIALTSAALDACHAFIASHAGPPHNEEQLEAIIAESLRSLLVLLEEERWLHGYDTHQIKAVAAITADGKYHTLTLHASQQADDSWIVGTPGEFPVSEEYLRRRRESEAAIIRSLS